MFTQALSQTHGRHFTEQHKARNRSHLSASALSVGLGCPECFSSCSPGPRHFNGTARVKQELSIFSHDPRTLAMPRCSWYLYWCCWTCSIPLAPGRVVPLRRLATSGSAETPGVAEECTSISVERQDAGSSTARLNITSKYTLMEESADRWRITTRSVSIYRHRITIRPNRNKKKTPTTTNWLR